MTKQVVSIKNIPPEARGCAIEGSISSKWDKWRTEHPKEYAQGYRPIFDENGNMTIRHCSEFISMPL